MPPPAVAAATVTGRPGRPLAAAAGALGVCVLVSVVDPNVEGSLGVCPFRAVTGGLDCPGCGALRCLRAVTRGDVGRALDHNLLVVALLPLLLVALVSWWRVETGRSRRVWLPPLPVSVGLAIVTPVFWVLRNLPVGAWLGSGAA